MAVPLLALYLTTASCGAGGVGPTGDRTRQPEASPYVARYLSPIGSDGNSGITDTAPWRTFDFARGQLHPGMELILLDGTYGAASPSGRLLVRGPLCMQGACGNGSTTCTTDTQCATFANAANGTAAQPIRIRAQNPGQALIRGDGLQDAVRLEGVQHWRLEDFAFGSADNAANAGTARGYGLAISRSRDSVLKNLLGDQNNCHTNSHVFGVTWSRDITIEGCEAYNSTRHSFSIFGSLGVTVRDSYAGRNRSQCGTDPAGGFSQEAVVHYCSSASTVENFVTENSNAGDGMVGAHGCTAFDGSQGGSFNRYRNIISRDRKTALKAGARIQISGNNAVSEDNSWQDFLVVSPAAANGANLQSASAVHMEYGAFLQPGSGGRTGIDQRQVTQAGECPLPRGQPCSGVYRNLIVDGYEGTGISVTGVQSCVVEWVNTTNNGANLSVSACTGGNRTTAALTAFGLTGTDCPIYVQAGSSMKGAGSGGTDLGPTIICKYRGGQKVTATSCEAVGQPYDCCTGSGTGCDMWAQTGTTPANCTGLGCQGAAQVGVSYLIAGINDVDGDSRFDVHERLNVLSDGTGCPIPTCG